MQRPDWYYDDRIQVGTDFSAEAEVATYDARQSGDAAKDRELLLNLGLASPDVLADIGCGTGFLACEAARICKTAYAIDVSLPMLSVTQQRAEAYGLSNIVTHHAGFLSVDLAPDSIDLITTQFALHHLSDQWKGVALDRLRRFLKPGGKVFIRDVVFSCTPSEFPALAESWIDWMLANTGYSRETIATHLREEHSTYGWIMEGLISEAGFELDSAKYSGGIYADYIAVKPRPKL